MLGVSLILATALTHIQGYNAGSWRHTGVVRMILNYGVAKFSGT